MLLSLLFLLALEPAHANLPGYPDEMEMEDGESHIDGAEQQRGPCARANRDEIDQVKKGNEKFEKFLQACARATGGSHWCTQLTRPNPDSIERFRCTYGEDLPHRLINPNEATWTNAFKAVQLVEELEKKNIEPCIIYNWWRPEPYNQNVSGSPTRHPFGTSVDVRFCSLPDMEKAFSQLCQWREKGRLRAVGYYGTTGLHFGVGDKKANTWGKTCRVK